MFNYSIALSFPSSDLSIIIIYIHACMKNRIVFDQLVAIIIVKDGTTSIYVHTHCKGRKNMWTKFRYL